RINLTAGTIIAYAGDHVSGFSGDGGAATSAEVNDPLGVDANGTSLYIADSGNGRIRSVNSSGTISTLAGNGFTNYSGDGGSPTNAELYNPVDVLGNASGDLYIADSQNNVVRKVPSGGNISTIAGNGTPGYGGNGGSATSAELDFPTSISLNGSNIFIGDTGNSVVRYVAAGTISNFAGDGVTGFSGDGGIATSASMNSPSGIVYDANGNLWVSDSGNGRVRVVSGGGAL